MADYIYESDGRIHTRLSELYRCTPGQIDRVIAERENPDIRVQTESMKFGQQRHEMFEEIARKTGKLPDFWGPDYAWGAELIEEEFATEILPGVVLHSRPDVVCQSSLAVVDYKTIEWDQKNQADLMITIGNHIKKPQLKIYSYQLGLHNIYVSRGLWLFEIWNKERDTILDYKAVEQRYTLRDLSENLPWIRDRVSFLVSAVEAATV